MKALRKTLWMILILTSLLISLGCQEVQTNEVDALEETADLSTFGVMTPKVMIYQGQPQGSDMAIVEYYTDESFESVTGRYDALLKDSSAYDAMYYSPDYATIEGLVGDVFVSFHIEKREDEEGETYVVYQYESDVEGADTEETKETAENKEEKMAASDQTEVYKEDLEFLDSNPDILIREEIGQIDFQEWKENWLRIEPPKTVFMMVHVKSEDYEFGPFEMDYDVYIKGKNVHMVGDAGHGEITITYNAAKNQTYTINKAVAGGYIEDGCSLPFRILGLEDFQYIEDQLNQVTGKFMPQYIENVDGSSEVMVWMPTDDGMSNFTYSFDERVMTSYWEKGLEMYYDDDHPEGIEVPYSGGFYTEVIKINVPIKDALFEF